MGKIFDALQKSASENVGDQEPESKTPTAPSPEKPPSLDREAIDSGRLNETLESPSSGQRSIQLLPVNEMLITCSPDGNRQFNFAAEQFKMLRSQILFPANGAIPRTILVTSAIPGEGKSVVASNLAVSIAHGIQEHVLLMECDLRRPSLCNIFGFKNCRGLSDYLSEKAELKDLFFKTGIEKLTMLPGGALTRNPYELLSSKRMSDLLEEVKNRYEDRYIILDSTPVSVAAETSVLSKFVDGIVLVVRYGKTSRHVIQQIVEKIGKDKFLGVVFNGFEGQYTNEYYYKYYGNDRKKLFKIFRRS